MTVNITVTQLFAVKGRLGQQIVFTSFGPSFPIGTEQRIAAAAVERLCARRDLRGRPASC